MTRPLVSVVGPTYDRPETLRRAVRSVAGQTYDPIELIVVDDCSPTPVSETLSEPDPELAEFTIVRHEENRGGNAARNTGIDASSGEYVAFLDDEWVPRKVEKQVAAFERASPEVGVVYTGVRQVGPDGTTNAIVTQEIEGDVTSRPLRYIFVGTFSVVMVRRSAVERVDGLDERFPSWRDWEVYVRLSQHCAFVAVPEPIVVRHTHMAGQISHDYERKRDISYPLFLRKFVPLAAADGCLARRQMLGHRTYQLARSARRSGEYGAACRHLLRTIAWYLFEPTFHVHLAAVAGGQRTYGPMQRLQRAIVRATVGNE